MKLSEFKHHLNNLNSLNFIQPNGMIVPKHFHITEAGIVTKRFIDCGGTIRSEKAISFQLWVASDTEHRLEPAKLLKIISLSEPLFNNEDLGIEIEYQSETIGRYSLDFQMDNFLLIAKQTDCLAKDNCGVHEKKPKLQLANLAGNDSCCTPGGGCC
jgi:hypothetical protein